MLGAAPAGAGLGIACPDATSKVFAPFADYANYASVPNGGFESGAQGWALSGGASVTTGNEPFFLRNSTDRYALVLPQGATATTPQMCIGLFSSKMRFVSSGDEGTRLKVQVIYRGLFSSVLGIFDSGTVNGRGSWQPSPEIAMLGGLLPLLTQSVQFRFVSVDGATQLDDAYLDPMMSA